MQSNKISTPISNTRSKPSQTVSRPRSIMLTVVDLPSSTMVHFFLTLYPHYLNFSSRILVIKMLATRHSKNFPSHQGNLDQNISFTRSVEPYRKITGDKASKVEKFIS